MKINVFISRLKMHLFVVKNAFYGLSFHSLQVLISTEISHDYYRAIHDLQTEQSDGGCDPGTCRSLVERLSPELYGHGMRVLRILYLSDFE
jgi:hypothetical protein